MEQGALLLDSSLEIQVKFMNSLTPAKQLATIQLIDMYFQLTVSDILWQSSTNF